ncbi:MAG: hypothetical protein QM764_14420 [Chitinophagaceae bacterium]
MNNNKTFWLVWGSIVLLSGIALLLLYLGFIDYGITIFCILPICIGIFTGVMPKKRKAVLGMAAALITLLLFLWATQLEGLVCIFLAIPVIALFTLVGYIIAIIIKRFKKKNDHLKISTIPFIVLLLAAGIDMCWKGTTATDSVTTIIELPYPDSIVYNHIKKVDTVTATKSFLHQLGLPYPKKCILTTEQKGGLRICEFEEGKIVETISDLRKNELLEMDITSYDLAGQNWFSFKKDIYQIKKDSRLTVISRTTTYSSRLKPRLYWKWIEETTIEAEQTLVFKNLKNELAAQSY